jgi:hypothetical protein
MLRKLMGVLCGLVVLMMLPQLFYNACGLTGSRDCADGPRWVLTLNVLASVATIVGGAFLSYRLFRGASGKKEASPSGSPGSRGQ